MFAGEMVTGTTRCKPPALTRASHGHGDAVTLGCRSKRSGIAAAFLVKLKTRSSLMTLLSMLSDANRLTPTGTND